MRKEKGLRKLRSIPVMWGDDGIEPAIYEDELEFDFLDRMLGGNETDYSSEGYIEAGAVPLFYKVLKYGICK